MDLRRMLFGPTLDQQKTDAKCIVRKNIRELKKTEDKIKIGQADAKASIKKIGTRPSATPEQRRQIRALAAPLAREYIHSQKQVARMHTQVATLESVLMQINEAYAMKKITNSMKTAVPLMKSVNSLVKIPELTSGMQELSRQLVTSGIIEEMVGDMMPDEDIYEDEAGEGEIDKVLAGILGTKAEPEKEATFDLPEAPRISATAEEEDEEANMLDMQSRLEALKS